MLVVKTFTAENIKLRTYVFIGWGKLMIISVVFAGPSYTYYCSENLPTHSHALYLACPTGLIDYLALSFLIVHYEAADIPCGRTDVQAHL